jgi:hypothetical protein
VRCSKGALCTGAPSARPTLIQGPNPETSWRRESRYRVERQGSWTSRVATGPGAGLVILIPLFVIVFRNDMSYAGPKPLATETCSGRKDGAGRHPQ